MSYFMVGAMIASTLLSAKAQQDQGEATAKIARNNATMADYAAKDAQARGEEEAMKVRRQGAALKSTQRVGLASSGLDIGYGTAADIQDQTDFFTQQDADTTRTNASREAWRYRAQAQDFRSQGSAAQHNANLMATSTLLSGASQVAGKWKPTTPKTTG